MIDLELVRQIRDARKVGATTEDILHALAGVLKSEVRARKDDTLVAAALDAERSAVETVAYELHNRRADAIRRAQRQEPGY